MNYQELQVKTAKYVTAIFADNKNTELLYHNINHTQNVVKAAQRIAEHYRLGDKDFFIITLAAWFHDTAYCSKGKENHEQESAKIASEYLKSQGVEQEIINSITGCILATKMPQSPTNLLEEIVCDADLFHLGTDDFSEFNKIVRNEDAALSSSDISKKEWRKCTVEFLKSHQYHTEYCRLLLNDKKQQNLENLIKKQKGNKNENGDKEEPKSLPDLKEKISAEKNSKETARGVETLFRITSTNNQRLSDMADNKAQILITVNSIILSVIISLLLRKLDNNTYLIFPTILILVISVVTMVVGILATRPSIPPGVFTQEDLDTKKVNLLFFGNFYKMTREDYAKGMWKVMEDRSFLYGTLIDDVYSQGVVLGRKYKLLRLAYNIFMYGIIASVIGFVISIWSFQ